MARHDEAVRYCAFALWLAGYSAGTIAVWLGMTRKQALGLCQRSPYGARASMSPAARQAALDELRAIRVGADGKSGWIASIGRRWRWSATSAEIEKATVRITVALRFTR